MALIQIRGLTKLYRMGTSVVRALDGVDLDIERGEFVAITGPSGSGKSTMMHLLGCLDRPTGGSFVFDNRDVSNLSDRQLADIRNQQIGFVFQTFNLINRTSALENVAVPLFYARRTGTHGPARRALETVGLLPRAGHRSNELSGGERQRVAIARAIVNNPLLVLADEPTGNLDSRTGQQIMDLFRRLNSEGVTVVLVTHEYDVAVQTRRIVQMLDGKILSDRPTQEVLRQEAGPLHLQVRTASGVALDAPAVAGEPVLAARAVATAPPPADEPADLGPPKLIHGANTVLVVGILAMVFLATGWGIGQWVAAAGFDPKGMAPEEIMKRMPPGYLAKSFAALGGMVLAFVLGVAAILGGRRVRRRMRDEPGNWLGRRRVITALLLGCVAAFGPILVSVGRAVVRAIWS